MVAAIVRPIVAIFSQYNYTIVLYIVPRNIIGGAMLKNSVCRLT